MSSVEKLEDFLLENSTLFTLVGVFGAISIYAGRTAVSSSNYTSELQNFAVVAGFSIVLLLATVIIINALRRVNSAESWLSYENWGIWSFLAFFIPLIFVIVGLVSQFPTIWGIYAYLLSYVSATIAAFALLVVPVSLIDWFTEEESVSRALLSIVVVILYVGSTTAILAMERPVANLSLEEGGVGFEGMADLFLVFYQLVSGLASIMVIFALLLAVLLLAANVLKRMVLGVKSRI